MSQIDNTKLQTLAEQNGYSDTLGFLEDECQDSVVEGICVNEGCDYSTSVEPDCDSGYCEECGTQTVKSALILAGII